MSLSASPRLLTAQRCTGIHGDYSKTLKPETKPTVRIPLSNIPLLQFHGNARDKSKQAFASVPEFLLIFGIVSHHYGANVENAWVTSLPVALPGEQWLWFYDRILSKGLTWQKVKEFIREYGIVSLYE